MQTKTRKKEPLATRPKLIPIIFDADDRILAALDRLQAAFLDSVGGIARGGRAQAIRKAILEADARLGAK